VIAAPRSEPGEIGTVVVSRWVRMVRMDAGAPCWRGRPSIADLAIAGVSAALGIAGAAAEVFSSGHHQWEEAGLADLAEVASQRVLGGAAIAMLAAVALLWRRRAPLAVALAIIGCCLIYHALGYPGLAPAVAMYPAVYTVAAYGPRRRLWLGLGLILAVALIPLLPPMPQTYNFGALIGPEIGMVAAVAVGEAARTRWEAMSEQLRAAQRTAAEQERRRLLEQRLDIAREVHDVLAHTITVITVQAAAAADALDGRPEDARAALAEVRHAARDASAELGGTLRLLRGETDAAASPAAPVEPEVGPPTVSLAPDVAAPPPGLTQLPELARQARAAGIEVALDMTGDPAACSSALELAAYRVVQEALTNVVRHARSDTARVSVKVRHDEICVEVTDDGELPQTSIASTAGHGLNGMRERVQAFGGSLEVGPSRPPHSGFRVFARLPVHPATRLASDPHQPPGNAAQPPDAAPANPSPGGGGGVR
jgi:signal transduction histidine kinase